MKRTLSLGLIAALCLTPSLTMCTPDDRREQPAATEDPAAAMEQAVAAGDAALLARLLEEGGSVEKTKLLYKAAARNDLACVKLLLAAGADPNHRIYSAAGSYPLHAARSPEVLRALIEAGADLDAVDIENNTPLSSAVAHADIELVRALLEVGANLEQRNKSRNGMTALHIAAWGIGPVGGCVGNPHDCLCELIKLGADVNARDDSGDTPLHNAAFWSSADDIRTLLAAGADVDAVGNDGRTPLHEAALCEGSLGPECIELLLAAGADPNARDAEGNTPLHLAAEWREWRPYAERALLEGGADPTIKNNAGQTPQDMVKPKEP